MTTLNTSNVINAITSLNKTNNALAQANANKEMQFNAEQAKLNRDWQSLMSNTAHQREVKDLIAAGLNPILSAGGSGASTPVGSSATGSTADVDTSGVSALVSYANSLISSATAITTAEISKAAMTEVAGINSAAAMYSANKNYQSTVYSSDKNYQNSENIAKNYPNNPYSLGASLFGGVSNFSNFVGNVASNLTKGGNVVSSLLKSAYSYNNKKSVTKRR